MKTLTSKYEQWLDNDRKNEGTFLTRLFSAYIAADLQNRIKLQKAFPKFFIPYPERGDVIETYDDKSSITKVTVLSSPVIHIFEGQDIIESEIRVQIEDTITPHCVMYAFWSYENQRWEI